MTIRITPFDTLNYHPGNQQANPIFKSPLDDHNQGQEVLNPNFDPEFDLNDGLVSDQKKSRRRLKLERSIEILKSVEIPGRVHAIRYLEHQYRWNRHWRTLQNNRISILFFLKFIKKQGRQYLEQVERKDLEAFVEHEQDRGLKPKSVELRIKTVYAFFRFLETEGVIHPNLLIRKIKIKVPRSLPKAMACIDVAKMLSVIKDKRDRAIILILLRTGMRIGELLNIMINDVDLYGRAIKIYEGEKNSVGRVVYLSDDALSALVEWMKVRNNSKSYLFYGLHGGKSYTWARDRFVRYMEKAGSSHKGYTLHCLRHTFATDLLNAGMRLECLQQLLGHTSIEVTRIYARLSDQTREKEYFRAMAKIEQGGANEYY
jgi:integrase/recombinase XerD